MDNIITIGALLGMAFFLSSYHKESILEPAEPLPIQTNPDVRQWKHSGAQPKVDTKGGNSFHAAEWPEIDPLLGVLP